MQDTLSSVEKLISHTAVAVGAPITGGGIGLISLIEDLVPAFTILSLAIGIVLGIMSYRLKRKLINKQIQEINERAKA